MMLSTVSVVVEKARQHGKLDCRWRQPRSAKRPLYWTRIASMPISDWMEFRLRVYALGYHRTLSEELKRTDKQA
jgi:hypothetical protein